MSSKKKSSSKSGGLYIGHGGSGKSKKKVSWSNAAQGYGGAYPPHAYGGGQPTVEGGYPLLGAPKGKNVIYEPLPDEEAEEIDIPFGYSAYIAKTGGDAITPITGPNSMIYTNVKSTNPALANQIMTPVERDNIKTKPTKPYIDAKISRLNTKIENLDKIENGKPIDVTYNLNPNSKAIAQQQIKTFSTKQPYIMQQPQYMYPPKYGYSGYAHGPK